MLPPSPPLESNQGAATHRHPAVCSPDRTEGSLSRPGLSVPFGFLLLSHTLLRLQTGHLVPTPRFLPPACPSLPPQGAGDATQKSPQLEPEVARDFIPAQPPSSCVNLRKTPPCLGSIIREISKLSSFTSFLHDLYHGFILALLFLFFFFVILNIT